MATEDYVPVTGDDWYQRRRNDAEGEFFRNVASQGPRKGDGGSTRQGIYCFTANGKLLAYKNAGQSPEAMREALASGLKAWNKLPPAERKPGAVHVGDAGKLDANYTRTPPPGGLVLRVFTRALEKDDDGQYRDADCKAGGGDEVGRDHLWITREEVRQLVPAELTVGKKHAVPATLVNRILRFHLVDNTRGEPPMWDQQEIRQSNFTLEVVESEAGRTRLRLEGAALMATDQVPQRAARGYDVRLIGHLEYDAHKKSFVRLDIVAIGEHWGDGPFTRGARPGRMPLGVAFELANGDSPADSVPPQGARSISDYLGKHGNR